jgi:hypothetical protein
VIGGTATVDGNTVWHEGNDGTGSSLDSDLLDGKDAMEFLDTSATPQTKAGDLTVGGTLTLTAGGLEFPDGSVQTSAVNFLPPDTCFDNVGRFVVCGDGAVKDNLTGLFWLEDANCLDLSDDGAGRNRTDWADANIAAAQLADGQCGLTDGSSPGDWRLATRDEWQVILDQANTNGCSAPTFPDTLGTGCCGVDPCAFAGVLSNIYWSSTTVTFGFGPSVAWAGGTIAGFVINNNVKGVNNYVWPVRAGP